MSEWIDRDDRQRVAQARYEKIMCAAAPAPVSAYIDSGVIGFVFGEMWRRGVLTPRDRRWITLACVGMAGAAVPMETHSYAALKSGEVTKEDVDEFLLFFATQAGWPRGSSMLACVMAAIAKIAEEDGEAMTLADFVPWADPVADGVRRAKGEAVYETVHGAPPPAPSTAFQGSAELDYLFGEIWSRDEYLTRRDRRLIAISCSAAAGIDAETADQLESALRSGDLTYIELQEVVLHIAVYLGWIVARRLDHLLVAAAGTGTDG